MDETHVVRCFLRNGTRVLLLRRSAAVDSYAGRWGVVAGHAEEASADLARRKIIAETGLGAAVGLVRTGEPFSVVDDRIDTEWVVHPYLFECGSRAVETNEASVEYEWVSPVEILHRDTVPCLWTAYERVAPTVETVAADRDNGSAYLSIRALEVLRDAAAVRTHENTLAWEPLAELARTLRTARQSMAVIKNRIDRVMYDADGDPARVLAAAETGIERARTADSDAASAATALLDGERVLTLSRSGTVRETLERADPAAVFVAESRPGGEGISVAESLTDATHVTLLPDAALAHALATEAIDAVLVGADAILADGRVCNKVGTRGAALAASHEGLPVYAVAAAAKVRVGPDVGLEPCEPNEVYDGDVEVDVLAPTFDLTPAECVTVVTEDGPQSVAEIERIANQHRKHAGWDG